MRQEDFGRLNKRESKAEATDREARAIIAAETTRRKAKTAALRRARLQRDAEVSASESQAK